MGEQQVAQGLKEDNSREVAITYETLFELLRREKSRDELQELQNTFFEDVIKYMQGKMNILANQNNELFATDEKEKTLIQLQNIKKILRDLYDRREKKIINLAINKSRTRSSIIDTSKLLAEERAFFESLCSSLDRFRGSILNRVLEARAPELSAELNIEQQHMPEAGKEGKEDRIIYKTEAGKEQALNTSSKELETVAEKGNVAIRFLSPVPQFVGPELEVYGPFEEDESALLPEKVANVLIEKGRAEIDEEYSQ